MKNSVKFNLKGIEYAVRPYVKIKNTKIELSYKELLKKYKEKGHSIKEITESLNKGGTKISRETVRRDLKKFKILVSPGSKERILRKKSNDLYYGPEWKKWFRREYINRKKSTGKIAKILEVSKETVRRYLKRFNIPVRSGSEARFLQEFPKKCWGPKWQDWLRKKYIEEEQTIKQMVEILKGEQKRCSRELIRRRLKEFCIPLRTPSETLTIARRGEDAKYRNQKYLEQQYLVKGLSIKQIAEINGVSASTVLWWIRRFGIPRWSAAEIRKYRGEWGRKRKNERQERWRKTEMGKASTQRDRAKRRMKMKDAPNTLTTQEWWEILEKYDHRCVYCGKKFNYSEPPTRDHIIPLSKGGGNTKENIVPACRSCNSKKGNKTIPLTNRNISS